MEEGKLTGNEAKEFRRVARELSGKNWKNAGTKGLWIKLPIAQVNLVQAAVDEGFWYHHAEPEYLMLAYWLPKTKQVLPSYATNRGHIGAFVMNDKREVFVVKENRGMFKRMGLWKFPTGFAEEGEDIFTAAKREVKEETGIDSEFLEILALRHRHEQFHGKSNLVFVCMMRPLSFVIQWQDSELEEAQWMPLEEFAAQPLVKEVEFLNHMYEVCKAKVDGGYSGFSQLPVSGFRDDVGESSFYFNAMDLKNAKDNAEDPKNAEKNVEDLNNAANANTKMRSRCCCDVNLSCISEFFFCI
nr:nudix hydrolase 2-like [Ziziphus jujuba var. spinosa]